MPEINIYAPAGFEPWDWRNPEEIGIGGSETCVVETSRRLAKRGHKVTVYAPIREDTDNDDSVIWQHYSKANTKKNGLWIVHRSPGSTDLFSKNKILWFVAQDTFYDDTRGGAMTEKRMKKYTRVLALCEDHQKYLQKQLPNNKNIYLSSNGIKSDKISILKDIERDPYKLIWTSSPDRGLDTMLKILARAREFEPKLNLSVCYGWDNIDKVIDKDPSNAWKALKDGIHKLPQENVNWLGRLNQLDLWQEYLKSSIWCYPTNFLETGAISSQEAQALGAIPVCPPLWALRTNVKFGISILGNPVTDSTCFVRYIGAILRLVNDKQLQKAMRGEMRYWALKQFDWEKVVDQYKDWIKEDGL
jgi:glycosyltransferase involved in cell wall biosynthesis